MDRTCRWILLLAVSCLAGGTSGADDVQVNTYTTGLQGQASVALNDDGDFVVAWSSDGSVGDDPSFSIQGQRFASDGAPAGGQFQVNTFSLYNQFAPSAAIGPDGNFIVVWTSDGQSPGVRGQRFAADGSAAGGEFQVDTYSGVYHLFASIAMAPDGAFVVVWQSGGSDGTDTSQNSIQGRRYAADGSPLSPQFQVNTFTTSGQFDPEVAVEPDGDFVVVWENYGAPGSIRPRIHGQRFASDGSLAGDEFRVDSSREGMIRQKRPVVALDAEGDFVVVWESDDGVVDEVWAQRYASDGSPVASEFRVISGGSNALRPAVAASTNGDFAVVWDRDVGIRSIIEGRLYASDGSDVGGTFQVNANPVGSHSGPSVSATGSGEFLVAWRGFETGGDDPDESIERSDVFLLTASIFADGFESGDTGAWSN